MEKQKLQNVVAYVYYNRLCWHKLLNDLIRPFTINQLENTNIGHYYFEFGYSRGAHIKICLAQSMNASNLCDNLEIALNAFLKASPSKTEAISYPLTGFFMDYPNNSYKISIVLQTDDKCNLTESTVKSYLSKSVLSTFGMDVITQERIFRYMIYTVSALIKRHVSSITEAVSACLALTNHFRLISRKKRPQFNTQEALYKSEIDKLYKQNTLLMNEIIKDVWSGIDPELNWLENLYEIYDLVSLEKDNNPLIRICETAYRLMGIDLEDKLIICQLQLLYRAFSEQSP